MMICAETPQWIKDNVESGGHPLDVFAVIVPPTEYSATLKQNALWQRFRFIGIGSEDREYWMQCAKDKYDFIKDEYDAKIKAQMKLRSDEATTHWTDSKTVYSGTAKVHDPPTIVLNAAVTAGEVSELSENDYTVSSESGLATETAKAYIEAISDVLQDFARQFDGLFFKGC